MGICGLKEAIELLKEMKNNCLIKRDYIDEKAEKKAKAIETVLQVLENIAYKIWLAEGDLEILEKHSINHWYNHFAYVQESVAVDNLRNRIDDIQELLKGE